MGLGFVIGREADVHAGSRVKHGLATTTRQPSIISGIGHEHGYPPREQPRIRWSTAS